MWRRQSTLQDWLSLCFELFWDDAGYTASSKTPPGRYTSQCSSSREFGKHEENYCDVKRRFCFLRQRSVHKLGVCGICPVHKCPNDDCRVWWLHVIYVWSAVACHYFYHLFAGNVASVNGNSKSLVTRNAIDWPSAAQQDLMKLSQCCYVAMFILYLVALCGST